MPTKEMPPQGYARIRIKGRITNIDYKEFEDGKKLTRVTVVVNDLMNGKRAEWFVAACWDRIAENAHKNLWKGAEVEFYGYPHLHRWKNSSEIQLKVIDMIYITKLKKPESYDPNEKF